MPAASRRLSSPYDLDARYGVKRGSGWIGYKVHLTETCDPGLPRLITNVITTDATVPDTQITEQVHQALAAKGLLPLVHAVDAGYVTAAHIVGAAALGIELLGPVGADTHHGAQAAGDRKRGGSVPDLSQRAFTVDWERHKVTCPRGAVSITWSPQVKPSGTPITRVQFSATDCRPCPVRSACTQASGKGRYGRCLTLLPPDQQRVLDKRRAEQDTDAWKDRYKIRSGIEGTISQAVRRTGIRRTRYTGHAKAHLGHITAAAAVNLARLDAHLDDRPPGTTRTSHLARVILGLAA